MYCPHNDHNKSLLGTIILIALIVITITFLSFRIFSFVNFNANCANYLRVATNAGTIENATYNADIAINFLKNHNLDSGFTSTLYKTQDENLEYFFKNLTDTVTSMKNLPQNASELEKSNVLLKFREVLLDNNSLSIPTGISIFPFNIHCAILGWMLFVTWSIVSFYFFLTNP